MRFKNIIKIIFFLIIFCSILFIGSINYFANNIIYFDRVKLQTEKPANPNDLGLNFTDEKINLENKGFCYGWYVSASTDTKKIVILVHGRESNKAKLLKYVSFLNKAQYNVFLMDFRNSGNSYYAPCSMGYYESRELVSAIQYLRQKYKVEDVVLMGFSMGGATSVLAAQSIQKSEPGITIKALVLDSTYSSFREIIQYRAKSGRFYNKYFIDLVLQYIGWRLKFNVDNVDLIKVLNQMTNISVFIIHGDKDNSVPQTNGKNIFDSLTAPTIKKESWFPENVGHTKAFDEYPEKYQEKILEFLKSAGF